MAHTIRLNLPSSCRYARAIIICNGDFSGDILLRAWKVGEDWENRAADFSVTIPDGLGIAFVRAYLEYKFESLANKLYPWLVDIIIKER